VQALFEGRDGALWIGTNAGGLNRYDLVTGQFRHYRYDPFVTAFYGLLDPASGVLRYCNAGHNPPYMFKVQGGGTERALSRIGPAMGVAEDIRWEQRTVQFDPGAFVGDADPFDDRALVVVASGSR
jgi:serine phosphatase RsbU (regulator of sigma subunit)